MMLLVDFIMGFWVCFDVFFFGLVDVVELLLKGFKSGFRFAGGLSWGFSDSIMQNRQLEFHLDL